MLISGSNALTTRVARQLDEVAVSVGKPVMDADFGTDLPEPDRDRLVLATAAGSVIGAGLGVSWGFGSQAQSEVSESKSLHGIVHPRLTGWSHHTVEDTHQSCSGSGKEETCHTVTDGWYHRYSPDVRNDQVGTYTTPEFHQTRWAEPLLGGFLGAVGGGLVGLGVGVASNALLHSLQKPEPASASKPSEKSRTDLARTTGIITLAGGAAGALGGGLLGHAAGVFEQGQKEVHSRSWNEPLFSSQSIGDIPKNYYENAWFKLWPSRAHGLEHGAVPVVREVPQYNVDGSVRMHEVSHTFDTARYGAVGGAVMGGLIGAGTGFAAGVAASTLIKMVDRGSRPTKG